MSAFPIIETERFILREINDSDVEEVFEMRSNPELMKFIPRPINKIKEEALLHIHKIQRGFEENESLNWGITYKNEPKIIGIIGYVRMQPENFRAEIGYILNKLEHKKGVMREIVKPLMHFGFKHLNLHSIVAVVDPANQASIALLQANGFTKEAHFREDCYFDGQFLDSAHYSVLKSDFDFKPFSE
jgi:ribosomal-protein-alanine N-acetyltransferase